MESECSGNLDIYTHVLVDIEIHWKVLSLDSIID